MMRKKGDLPLTVEEISRAKMYAAQGYSCRAIGRELKRSDHTIARLLARPNVADEVVVQKRDLADLYEQRNHEILDAVSRVDIDKANLLQKITSAAICTDKMRLLRDQSISNVNVQVLVDVLDAIRRRDQPHKYKVGAREADNPPELPEPCQ